MIAHHNIIETNVDWGAVAYAGESRRAAGCSSTPSMGVEGKILTEHGCFTYCADPSKKFVCEILKFVYPSQNPHP